MEHTKVLRCIRAVHSEHLYAKVARACADRQQAVQGTCWGRNEANGRT